MTKVIEKMYYDLYWEMTIITKQDLSLYVGENIGYYSTPYTIFYEVNQSMI